MKKKLFLVMLYWCFYSMNVFSQAPVYKWVSKQSCTGGGYAEFILEKLSPEFNPNNKNNIKIGEGQTVNYILVRHCDNEYKVLRLGADKEILPPLNVANESEFANAFSREFVGKETGVVVTDANKNIIKLITPSDKYDAQRALLGYATKNGLPIEIAGNFKGADVLSLLCMDYVEIARKRYGNNLNMDAKHKLSEEASALRLNGSSIKVIAMPSNVNGKILKIAPFYKELTGDVKLTDVSGKTVWQGFVDKEVSISMKSMPSGKYYIIGQGKPKLLQISK